MYDNLYKEYLQKKERIKNRLNEFKSFYTNSVSWFYDKNEMKLRKVSKNNDERLFEELVFCILTANGSAKSGMKAVDSVRDVLMTGTKEQIQEALKKSGVRFHNRAEYIVENREKLKQKYNFDFKKIIEAHKNPKGLREFFVNEVKGFGYKEASHFLRNIGVFGLAILDKHILKTLNEFSVIEEMPKTLSRNKYLEIEQKYMNFSKKLNINPYELDLLFWSMKNGEIMK